MQRSRNSIFDFRLNRSFGAACLLAGLIALSSEAVTTAEGDARTPPLERAGTAPVEAVVTPESGQLPAEDVSPASGSEMLSEEATPSASASAGSPTEALKQSSRDVPPPPSAPPELVEDRWRPLGTVMLDAEARLVIATGFVNQTSGPIELMICGPGGKRHESVFVMEANPLDLQTALLLLGLEPGPPRARLGEGPPLGPVVDIWVEWTDSEGRRQIRPAERFAYNTEKNAVFPLCGWAFTGSVTKDGEFKALAEESIAATYWDPWAILNVLDEAGADDEIVVVNKDEVPPYGLHVRFILQPRR